MNAIDLIVEDVPSVTEFFAEAIGLDVAHAGDRFAELHSGGVSIMLSPDALVPTSTTAGVIVHIAVSDLDGALSRARDAGARVALDRTRTDWGTEIAIVAGPSDLLVQFDLSA